MTFFLSSRCFALLCLPGPRKQPVDENLADLHSILGLSLAFKADFSDANEAFSEESPCSGLEDFMSENMTFEPTSDEDNVLKSKRNKKIIVKSEKEEDLINKDNMFTVGEQSNDDDTSPVGDEKNSPMSEE